MPVPFWPWRIELAPSLSLMLIKPKQAAEAHTVLANLDRPTAMFRHRQQLRRWAARVLLLWLFGFGAGIANACISTGPNAPAASTASHLGATIEGHSDIASHDHARADGGALPSNSTDAPVHQGSLAKTNCKDFCGKAAVSIPPLKSALDDVQSHAVIATAAVTVLPMPAFAPVQLWVPRRDGVQAPPILIAFLRLAL